MTKQRWISIAVVIALGCGGPSGPTEPDDQAGEGTPTAGDESPEQAELRAMIEQMITAPETPWSEMSHSDRGTDMVMRFEPVMRVLFQDHDPEEFGHFGCDTCHGEDADARAYHMPVSSLPPVPLRGTPAYQQMAAAHPEDTRFMEERVTPAMQTMLGMGETFTCNGCHPTAR